MVSSEKKVFGFIFLFLWIPRCLSSSKQSLNRHSLAVGSFEKLRLSLGSDVKVCPNPKLGTLMVCERVHIHGLSRVKNLRKFAHSVIIKISGRNSGIYLPKAQVCVHRNISLEIGMCPDKKWETFSNGSWSRSMSPFENRLLDVRTVGSSLESFEVSIEEEFFLYRVIYLVSGIVMMSSASLLSHSLMFYYGSSMASGAILVILVVFFQGMKKAMGIIPTSPKTSLLIYSSIVGFLSFLLYHYHSFWSSILTEGGVDEVFSYALGVLLLASIVLDGAWLGFWLVRKSIRTEEGLVDLRIAQIVAWSIRIFASLLIIQSTVDHVLAAEALIFLAVSTILGRTFRLRIIRRLFRKLKKLAKRKHEEAKHPDPLAFDDFLKEDHMHRTPNNEDFEFLSRSKKFTVSPPKTAYHGSIRSNESSQLYISSFHTTPERRRFSKPEWEKFTRDSTTKAVEELVSSPDFGRWASKNAERITVTPPGGSRAEQRRKWFPWF